MSKKTILTVSLILISAFFGGTLFFLDKKSSKKTTIENFSATQESQTLEKSTEVVPKNKEALPSPEGENYQLPDGQAKVSPKDESAQTQTKESPGKTGEEQKITSTSSSGFIKNKLVSWGFAKSSSRKIDTIIVHSSYDALGDEPYSLEGILEIYKQYGVAAHYIIDREGDVFRLVEDQNIAYHAGVSSVPDGRTNVNDFSIGIELINTKTDKYTSSQYASLNKLITNLSDQYKIKYILGHDEIAPERKDDPWNFDWEKIEARNK